MPNEPKTLVVKNVTVANQIGSIIGTAHITLKGDVLVGTISFDRDDIHVDDVRTIRVITNV